MIVPECRYSKSDGSRCHSPALRGRAFCYYHGPARPARRKRSAKLVLPQVRDAASFHQALSQILVALAANQLDSGRAGKLLYGVQLAARNLNVLR